MRVLLTNDDGIRAPGLLALHRALAEKSSSSPRSPSSRPRATASRSTSRS
ncbi:MAG: hypothetical protein D6781_14055 [Verrucomicrobia bacterium]|nr:MAG: hypothetical protein D6781_14055 [Verrucomicrobiota bacterium]